MCIRDSSKGDDDEDEGDDTGEVWKHDLLLREQAQRLARKGRHVSPSEAAAALALKASTAAKKLGRRHFLSRAYKHNVLGVVGLKNMGNTCYMNASLQCLAACRLLREYLLEDSLWSHDLNATANAHRLGMGGKLAVSFQELLQDMWSPSNAGAAIMPKAFKKTVGQFNSRFKGYQQQDAQELISTLLGALHEDLNRVHDKPYNEQPDSNNRSDEVVAQEWWRNHLRRDLSVITALFTGQFKSSLTCQQCSYESSRFEPFSFLPVPLPENPKRYQRVTLHGYGVVPLQLSLCVETTSTIKHVLEELCRILHEDYLAHQDFYDNGGAARGGGGGGAGRRARETEKAAAVMTISHRHGRRVQKGEAAEALGFGDAQLKDLLPIMIERYRINDVLPITSSLAGFDYGHSVIHVMHAPLLGGKDSGIDLTSDDAVGEVVQVNMNGHTLQGERAPCKALYKTNGRFYAATIARVFPGTPDMDAGGDAAAAATDAASADDVGTDGDGNDRDNRASSDASADAATSPSENDGEVVKRPKLSGGRADEDETSSAASTPAPIDYIDSSEPLMCEVRSCVRSFVRSLALCRVYR